MAWLTNTPAELLRKLDRTHNETRLMAQALENIEFGHPYKKFVIRARSKNEDNGVGNLNVTYMEVIDFTEPVCTIKVFEPSGNTRNKLQLEFSYNYDVHNKEPRNVRRTSNIKKFEECVQLIKPMQTKAMLQMDFSDSDIEDVTMLRKHRSALKDIASTIYYGNVEDFIPLFQELIDGTRIMQSTVDVVNKFVSAKADYGAAKDEEAKLKKAVAVVAKNYFGNYKVGIIRNGNLFEEDVSYYEKAEDLPESIFGKLAVIDIKRAGSVDDLYLRRQGIEGIGSYVDREYCVSYSLIGEDLDTRKEGQESGS